MKIKIGEVRSLCEKILVKKGVSKEDAKIVADEYIDGELCGKKSHGLQAFPDLIKTMAKPGKWSIEKETDSSVLINANGNFGQVVVKNAVDMICKKAKKNGIAMAAIKNTMTILRPATPARMMVEKGMIGIVFNNGGRNMTVPAGGIDPVLATNPIGVGIPTNDISIIFDMATSKRAWGEVRVAKTLGTELSKETFMNESGEFTRDPDKAHSVVPFGDYKGYALALLIEILTGSLVDMPMGSRSRSEEYRTSLRGTILIAIDPSKFTNIEDFKQKNSKLIASIKNSRKAKGISEIRIPGEQSQKRKSECLKKGHFDIDEKIINEIKSLDR